MGTRVVLDTNILISALGWGGKPEDCLTLVFEDEVNAYCSPSILDELTRVMEYDRFDFSEEEKQSFLEIITAEFHLIEPDSNIEVVETDPDDNKFLECAISANADYLISGDSHLLDLGSYQGITILSPADFLEVEER